MATPLAVLAIATVATLPGWADVDPRPALRAFRASCKTVEGSARPTRAARAAPEALKAVCVAARRIGGSAEEARTFFEAQFEVRRVPGDAFFTGYYEPVVDASLRRTTEFATPLYGLPPDLVHAAAGRPLPGIDPSLTVAHRGADGRLEPVPDRAAIMAGALAQAPLVYVRDAVEAFFIQVQGSARLRLADGRLRRLVFAGRNGYPYTSIGKLLVDRLHVPPAEMGMTQLKAWIRANGQGLDEAGGKLMAENRSYIFFRFDDSLPPTAGPIGGSGISLTPGVSLAIDRTRWPYGLPFYVDATLPADGAAAPDPFRRLMVGQDTGSAIVGEARGDIFFGSGTEAADRAGAMREHGVLYVLWPRTRAEAPR